MSLYAKEIIVTAVGGALGSVLRFVLSRSIQKTFPLLNLPLGIIVVNVLGCFCIGILFGVFSHHALHHPLWRIGLMVGVLGGFTTFSSFSLETIVLFQNGFIATAVWNVLISMSACLLATALGVQMIV